MTTKATHRRRSEPSAYSGLGLGEVCGIAFANFQSDGLAVMVGVEFAGFFGMMRGVVEVPLGDVRMVARFFMTAGLMLFGGGAMVFGGEVVVLRCLAMMVCCFYGHVQVSF